MARYGTVLDTILALAIAAGLTGCGSNPGSVAGVEEKAKAELEKFNSPVRSSITLGKVGVLSKTATISLRKLILTAVSATSPADTVRDTSTLYGSETITVKRLLKLKPLMTWTLKARTLDQRDSVIHRGESQPFSVKPADTAEVSLNLASRFVMYQATFTDLPNNISTSQAGLGKVAVNLNRVVLKIDGAVKGDSLVTGGYFAGGQSVTLTHDYVTPGLHTVLLEAYGLVESHYGLLFAGTATFSSVAGEDNSKPVTLNWVGPSTGAEKAAIILGRIGKVTLIGGFNPIL